MDTVVSTPHVGDLVPTEYGQGTVQKVFYGIITKLNPRRRFQICTVLLDTPYENKQRQKVTRVEAEVKYQRSKVYEAVTV